MSTIIWNKLILHVLSSKKYQIEFFNKHAYIQYKILVVERSVDHSGTSKDVYYSGTYKSG